jgi:hypothetical protein
MTTKQINDLAKSDANSIEDMGEFETVAELAAAQATKHGLSEGDAEIYIDRFVATVEG